LPPVVGVLQHVRRRRDAAAAAVNHESRAGLIETDAAVRTAIGGLVVSAGWSKAAGAVPEHSAYVPSASGARESSRKRCPRHQGHGPDGYRQTTRVRLERHQRRERETEKGDRNQDRVRPQHAPPEPVSDSLRHAPSLDRFQGLYTWDSERRTACRWQPLQTPPLPQTAHAAVMVVQSRHPDSCREPRDEPDSHRRAMVCSHEPRSHAAAFREPLA
jgi:hypothetical protein